MIWFAYKKNFISLSVVGDLKSIVDWANNVHHLHTVELSHWLRWVRELIGLFQQITFCHIYREFNRVANGLSKKVIGSGGGHILWEEHSGGSMIDSRFMSLI